MTTVLRISLFMLAAWLSTISVHAKLYQVVRVNWVTWEVVEVQGKRFATEALTSAISNLVLEDRVTRVQLVVPIGIRKARLDYLMRLCRNAGVKSFEVVKKD